VTGNDPTPDEVLNLERRRLRSLVEPDLEAARALHAPDYELITPAGVTYSRDSYLGAIVSGELDYATFEPENEAEVRVRVYAGAAVVRYIARIVVAFPGGVDHARVWHTDLWERREDGWQATWSQATRLPPRAE
jgi:hypothetical protein